jgi:hypothetical protein
MEVNHAPAQVLIKGTLISVDRGQSAKSQDSWAKTFGKGWNRRRVSRFFLLLESDHMVVIKTTNKTTILTVCNYEGYQEGRPADGTSSGQQGGQRTGQQTGQQARTNKNEKNEKEGVVVREAPHGSPPPGYGYIPESSVVRRLKDEGAIVNNPADEGDWRQLLSDHGNDYEAVAAAVIGCTTKRWCGTVRRALNDRRREAEEREAAMAAEAQRAEAQKRREAEARQRDLERARSDEIQEQCTSPERLAKAKALLDEVTQALAEAGMRSAETELSLQALISGVEKGYVTPLAMNLAQKVLDLCREGNPA